MSWVTPALNSRILGHLQISKSYNNSSEFLIANHLWLEIDTDALFIQIIFDYWNFYFSIFMLAVSSL